MIRSMTAYAGNEVSIGDITLNCELRSVNHRYCDITLKLPDHLRFIETDLRSLLATKINRGKVECAISYKKQAKNGQSFNVNMEAVAALLAATDQIEQQMQASLSFSALDILAFPNITQEPSIDKLILNEEVTQLVKTTLAKFLEVR